MLSHKVFDKCVVTILCVQAIYRKSGPYNVLAVIQRSSLNARDEKKKTKTNPARSFMILIVFRDNLVFPIVYMFVKQLTPIQ